MVSDFLLHPLIQASVSCTTREREMVKQLYCSCVLLQLISKYHVNDVFVVVIIIVILLSCVILFSGSCVIIAFTMACQVLACVSAAALQNSLLGKESL